MPNGGHLGPAGVNMGRFVPPHWAPMGTNGPRSNWDAESSSSQYGLSFETSQARHIFILIVASTGKIVIMFTFRLMLTRNLKNIPLYDKGRI